MGLVAGAVVQQMNLADGGVAALIAIYRDERISLAAELVVEFHEPVKTQSALPRREEISNIFDFTKYDA
jgi:hypothetical protein